MYMYMEIDTCIHIHKVKHTYSIMACTCTCTCSHVVDFSLHFLLTLLCIDLDWYSWHGTTHVLSDLWYYTTWCCTCIYNEKYTCIFRWSFFLYSPCYPWGYKLEGSRLVRIVGPCAQTRVAIETLYQMSGTCFETPAELATKPRAKRDASCSLKCQ
jgi:hypothetical protein